MLFLKKLLVKKKNFAGRNNGGRITCRHRGGALSKRFLVANLRRRFFNVLGQVLAIRRDSVRTAFLALVFYKEFGVYEYILAPANIKKGSLVCCFEQNSSFGSEIAQQELNFIFNIGNSFMLKNIKIGSKVFNLEKWPGSGGLLMRAAGTLARLVQKILVGRLKKSYVIVRLKSGKIFYLKGECFATLGQSSNPDYIKKSRKKAGVLRRLGTRPRVRGVAMNPIDHPHGGGEGKTSGGRTSVSAWGKLTKGKRTLPLHKKRKNKKILKKFLFSLSKF